MVVVTNKVHLDLLICFLQYSMASSLLSLVDDFCVWYRIQADNDLLRL